MAENSRLSPNYEYTKVDVTVTLTFADGTPLNLLNRWEKASFKPGAQNGTAKGSGRKPRAHVATRYEPELSITMDKDLADYVVKKQGNRSIKEVKCVRQRPDESPITDVYYNWKASYPDTEYGDDATSVEVTGNLLDFEPDKQNKITIRQ